VLYQFDWEAIKVSGYTSNYKYWLEGGGLHEDTIFEENLITGSAYNSNNFIRVKRVGLYKTKDPTDYHSLSRSLLKPYKPRPLGDWK